MSSESALPGAESGKDPEQPQAASLLEGRLGASLFSLFLALAHCVMLDLAGAPMPLGKQPPGRALSSHRLSKHHSIVF